MSRDYRLSNRDIRGMQHDCINDGLYVTTSDRIAASTSTSSAQASGVTAIKQAGRIF